MNEYDVAIVGGGLLGSAFGWGLACRGLRTVIFDEGDNAIRTARGNFGLVWVQGKGVGMPEYARWSLDASRNWGEFADSLGQATGINLHYQRRGGIFICLDEAELAENIRDLETLRREAGEAGYDYELLDAAGLKKSLPAIGEVAGGSYCPHDGHCNPLKLLRALHKGFADLGGRYRPWTTIKRIVGRPDGGFELRTDDGEVVGVAQKIIIAAGHGSPELGLQVGLDIPVYPDQGQVIVTEKSRPVLDYPTNYVRQTDEGGFLLGPSSRDVGFDLSTGTATIRDIARRCIQAFPMLDGLRVQRIWAALRVMTPDGFPVYQQSASHPGAFSFACHSGVTLAPNHALIVTDWVANGAIPAGFEVFHPRRFHVQTTANPR